MSGSGVLPLRGEQIEVRLSADGKGPLAGLVRPAGGHDYLDLGGLPCGRNGALWALHLVERQGGPAQTLTNNAARFAGWERARVRGSEALVGRWELPEGGEVQVTFRLDEDGQSVRWACACQGVRGAGGASLERVTGQIIHGLGRSAARHAAAARPDELVVPRMAGRAFQDTPETLFGNAALQDGILAPYPGGFTAQCVTYQDDVDGLLLATLDPTGAYKRFALQAEADHSRFRYAVEYLLPLLPESASGESLPNACTLPYELLVSAYAGDWQQGAARYRVWALQQPWCAAGPLEPPAGEAAPAGGGQDITQRAGRRVPRWLRENALWAWNRGRAASVVPPAVALRRALGLPVALDWYWWHHAAYDTNFPDYFPPRDGEAGFRAAVDALHAAGVRVVTYINGRLCGLESDAWTQGGAGAFAARDAAGAHGAEVYNRFNQAALAPMCPATAYWQEKLASIVGELAGRYDVDGVYVDQIGMASPRPCYDPSHGHPLGGGTWWLEGNRFAVAGMRAQLSRPGEQALLTESCAEVYLGLFDGFVVLDNSMEKFGAYRHTGERCRPVPLLPAIYHGYAVTFGSYASLADPPYDDLWPAVYRPAAPLQLQNTRWLMQLRVELARTLGDGNQPMLANFQPHHLTERAPAMDFVLRLARLYNAARPYLLAGARLPEPEVDAPPVKVEFWGKSVYTLPGHDQVFTRTLPAVLATAWMAADGSVAVTAINITADAVRCTLRLPDEGTRAIAATGEAPLRWEDGETSPLTWSGGPTLELALAGTAAVLVRWERAAGRVSTRS